MEQDKNNGDQKCGAHKANEKKITFPEPLAKRNVFGSNAFQHDHEQEQDKDSARVNDQVHHGNERGLE